MPFTDLLRLTVFLAAAEATALGAVTVLVAGADDDNLTLLVSAVWWPLAVAIGLYLGRRSRSLHGVRDALAAARTTTSLPRESASRIAVERLWPIGLTAVIAGALGIFYPRVAS